jgi:hypothetical protein|tara:strand:+ start:455 stop:862 length:408 start_codon:yes stop_codon:yes gene_type:complete
MEQPTADQLAFALENAKEKEARAKRIRIEWEEAIIAKMGAHEEGALTIQSDYYKITTTGKVSRTLDQSKVPELIAELPEALAAKLFKVEFKLNTKLLKSLPDTNPEMAKKVSAAITAKPGKTTVSVTRLEVSTEI